MWHETVAAVNRMDISVRESVVAQVGFGGMPGLCEFGALWDFGDRPVEPTLVSIESFQPHTNQTSGKTAIALSLHTPGLALIATNGSPHSFR